MKLHVIISETSTGWFADGIEYSLWAAGKNLTETIKAFNLKYVDAKRVGLHHFMLTPQLYGDPWSEIHVTIIPRQPVDPDLEFGISSHKLRNAVSGPSRLKEAEVLKRAPK